MVSGESDRQRPLEICLILVCIGLAGVLHSVSGFKLVVLNLFYLPIVIAAFYLGRYRAGILSLFCVISATVITVWDLNNFAVYSSPIAVGLAVTLWGAVMGLNALLAGTLSDERTKKLGELHDAYLGVVEVLSRYLSSADPERHHRSRRVAELSAQVARTMKLADGEVDDVRVAALLYELENVQITAKAIGDFGARALHSNEAYTFRGSDLLNSLGSVLGGALPLLTAERPGFDLELDTTASKAAAIPKGAKIIQTVRAYDACMDCEENAPVASSAEAVRELKADLDVEHDPDVLAALEQCVIERSSNSAPPKQAEAARDLAEV